MGNDIVYSQVSTILNELQQQATGTKAITNINATNFVNVAQTLFMSKLDPVIQAINSIVNRTIFSIRPYSKKFSGLEVDGATWGAHVRKIKYVDNDAVNDDMWTYPVLWKKDGVVDATPNRYYQGSTANPSGNLESLDMYLIRKPDVLQTNFYGANVYSDFYTVFRKELFEVALSSPEEFMRFWSGYILNINNKHIQWDEDLSRLILCNLIASLIDEGNNNRVIYLLSEYQDATGVDLNEQSVFAPDNFKAFVLWLNSYIDTLTRKMSERSALFQTNITGKTIMQHTNMRDLKVYMLSEFMTMIRSMVLPITYHENYIRFADTESVSYWQSIESPRSINITPVYTDVDGTLKTGAAVSVNNVVGVLFDREAAGYTRKDSWTSATPWNSRGGYYDTWIHKTLATYNDNTEKAVVLLLAKKPDARAKKVG